MAKQADTNAGFERFKAELKQGNLGNFYIFYGEEAYLRTYYLDQVKKKLIDDFTEAFNFHRFTEENLTPDALADSVESIPMMAERSLVIVEDIDFYKQPEDARNTYAAVFSDLPDYCTVILTYDTVEYKQDKRMKTLSQAMENAVEVQFNKPSERELSVWIYKHFKPHGQEISESLCRYFIQITGGSMTRMATEIEKVAAYAKEPVITREDIDAVVEPVMEAVVFDLTDAIAAGRYETALLKLSILLQKQEEPISILANIGSQFRRIAAAHTLRGAGMNMKDLMALCGCAAYPAERAMEFARRISEPFCEKAVALCLETDLQMKTSYDDPQRLLELLVLRLAQEARRG